MYVSMHVCTVYVCMCVLRMPVCMYVCMCLCLPLLTCYMIAMQHDSSYIVQDVSCPWQPVFLSISCSLPFFLFVSLDVRICRCVRRRATEIQREGLTSMKS